MNTTVIDCAGRPLGLERPRVMGVLNVTPDSFSDGGRFLSVAGAIDQAARMLDGGAAIIDIGGESTRPGAADVDEQEELDRTVPVVEAIVARFDTIVSIDTSKPPVMRAAARAGVGLINDVRALAVEGALEAVRDTALPVCLMHMQGEPRTMQKDPVYVDVVAEVGEFLAARIARAEAAGIERSRILIDPGFGFGKNLNHNLALLRHIAQFTELAPVLAGVSRKRMIGAMIGDDGADRTVGSVTAALLAAMRGARVLRVHDVQETVHALAVWTHFEHTGIPEQEGAR